MIKMSLTAFNASLPWLDHGGLGWGVSGIQLVSQPPTRSKPNMDQHQHGPWRRMECSEGAASCVCL